MRIIMTALAPLECRHPRLGQSLWRLGVMSVCVYAHANCQLPHHGGVFSCNQFSPAAVLCLLIQASPGAGQAYAQPSSGCEAVRVRRPMYTFSPGHMELCHHFGQRQCTKGAYTGDLLCYYPHLYLCVCVCVCVCMC